MSPSLWVEHFLGVQLDAVSRSERTVTGERLLAVRAALPSLRDGEDELLALAGGHPPFDPSDQRAAWEHLARWHHMCPAEVIDARRWGHWHSQVHGHWNREGHIDDAYPVHGHRPHEHRR